MSSDPQAIPNPRHRPSRTPVDAPADRRAAGAGAGPGPAGRWAWPRARRSWSWARLILVSGLGLWVAQLLPGRGHFHEPLVEPSRRPRPVTARAGTVEHLRSGMPGYRLRMPAEVHPISAGIKGGIVGGLVMPVPALTYGLLSGHGLWYPVNLLAGMVLPGVGSDVDRRAGAISTVAAARGDRHPRRQFGGLRPDLRRAAADAAAHPPAAGVGRAADARCSGRPSVSDSMGLVNPLLRKGVDWPWFIASQFVFGVVAALTVMRAGTASPAAGRAAGRHRRRPADADPGRPLGPVERSWDLVSGQPAGGDGPAQAWTACRWTS